MLQWVWSVVRRLTPPEPEPPAHPDSDHLIDTLEVLVTVYCPCGSRHIHHLALTTTSECARCGRTLAIRSIHYLRSHYNEMPTPVVSVGYVFTPENLRARTTQGVH